MKVKDLLKEQDYFIIQDSSTAKWLYKFNWTTTGSKAEISITLKSHSWKVDNGLTNLYFTDGSPTVSVPTNPPLDQNLVDKEVGSATSLEAATSYFKQQDLLATLISFISQGAPSAPIIQMLKLFKIFFR